ncbi:acetoacetyl-CoA synthetase-like [Watersipora subatra]|uniref:acetoacetyl-CoA synthetase-like n=1 Tax=Watersipora subatra TaxID=2589382 RepID=UPI00355C393D
MGDAGNDKLMWHPKKFKDTLIGEFVKFLESPASLCNESSTKIACYNDLYKWSLDNMADFWGAVWKFCGVKASRTYDRVLPPEAPITSLPRWFEGSRLNYAENALHWNDDHVALYFAREGVGAVERVTYAELRRLVRKYASALRKAGVITGDRVVGYIPNCVEAVAAMLSASSIGAIWSCASPDFGASGVLDRFRQISPKVLFSVNAIRYNGKLFNHLDKLQQVVQELPCVEKVVVINYVDGEHADLSQITNSIWLEEFIKIDCGEEGTPLTFEQLPFSHPLFIMYSSGTTGTPKCIVHSQGGVLLKHLEEHVLQGNTTRLDSMLYYTTTGWMMWNWLLGLLPVGATCVLYDGSPLVPSADVLWNLVDELKITVLGTGAKWLSVLEDRGVRPKETHKLTSLHSILSTGSPLKPESYEYVYRNIKSDVLLGSITGGTDIVGCFAAQNWTVPVYKGEIQSRNLGCAMECWDENGEAVLDQSGELVITKPFPSMPVFFWNDQDGSRYQSAYFKKYPGIWSHGDFCQISSVTGGIKMLGRSDGILNPNGVRFGSAEIYSIVEELKEVQDSVCIAQRKKDNSEERVVLFVKLWKGVEFSALLVKLIQSTIRQKLSARHVPAVVLSTAEIPYTLSGKKVELAVRDVVAGKAVSHRAAFSNPQSLDLFANIPELQGY